MAFQPVTPMRAVPGAFINTPAVPRGAGLNGPDTVRRRLFPQNEASAPGALARPEGHGALPAAPTGAGALGTAQQAAVGGVVATAAAAAAPVGAPAPAGQLPLVTGVRVPPVAEVSPVVRAARAINRIIQSDESYPDLDSYCRQGASSEYNILPADSTCTPFHRTQMFPIPNSVFSHYNASQLQTLMGLFAEINHAWVAIDNSLYLWDYTAPEPELIGFEEQPHTIQAVALVPPKPGIFVNSITHILVVATTADVILLGLSAQPTPSGTRTVSLYQTRMTLATRGSDVSIIAGSASGRIFFGGSSDTDIYELYYQQEERWFSNRCGKINHSNPGWASVVPFQSGLFGPKETEHLVDIVIDDSRNLVYTLSSRSTIRTYHMEAPNRLNKVIEKEKNHCLRDITHMINTSPLLNDRMVIVSISPISSREALKLHLMALTNTGCRLFLSATNSASYTIGASSGTAPQSMQVQFIKFPPSSTDSNKRTSLVNDGLKLLPSGRNGVGDSIVDLQSSTLKTSRMGARFPPGFFLDFVSKDNVNVDSLFVSAPETGRIKFTAPTSAPKYYEHGSWIDIGSRAEAVGQITKPFAAASQPLGFGNELAVQFDEPPSEFAVLTNTGVHVIRRRRLVDMFAATLRSAGGDDGVEREARRFIQLYGRVETIATALAVACGHGNDTRPGNTRAVDQATEDRAKAVFIDFGGQPTIEETDGTPLSADLVRLSSRHEALALYLGRLVRTLWKVPVISVGPGTAGGVSVSSKIPSAKLASVQDSVARLARFLSQNRSFIHGLSGPSDLQRASSQREEVSLQAEHRALHALERLMESISEGISFVQMLFDERVGDIYARLDEPTRKELRALTYEALFSASSGKDLAKILVKAIVNRNIESGSKVETVADALRRRCGSFCSPDDVIIFKAQEQLQRATEQMDQNSNQTRTLLHESLRHFSQVAGNLSFANLQAAVAQYAQLRFYAGAIQLCLVVAREKDRGNVALAWVNDGKPAGDPREASFAERKRCYDLVHEVLRRLDEEASREPEMVDGRLSLTATKRLEAYEVVHSSDDEVFHFDLYAWYIEQGWTDRILAVDSPHVITFLELLAQTNIVHADLLCRFYTHHNQFYKAAVVQYGLAQSDFEIGIQGRITLLSRAKANANVSSPGVARQEQQLLNHNITELLEVAHIQDDVLQRLRADDRLLPERLAEIEAVLDGKALSLTELFNEYADQAGYYDICLLIYHAADYRIASTIAETWRNLIQQTHNEVEGRNQEPGIPTGPLPYESVSAKIQSIAHRTSCDSVIFPVEFLLPELCEYARTHQQDRTIGADPTWPVQLFLSVGISHDMITRILETTFDTQDHGFTGNARLRVVELVLYVVDSWAKEVRRRGGNAGRSGNGIMGSGVSDLLARCRAALPAAGEGRNEGGAHVADIRRKVDTLLREVSNLSERTKSGSLRFA